MGEYFFLNGKIIQSAEAYLHITDLALLRGFGVFDFCRTQKGFPLLLDRYLNRFYDSARFIDLQVPHSKEQVTEVIYSLLQKNGFPESGIRMILTGGYTQNGYTPGDPNFFILIERINFPEKSLYEHGIKLLFHEHRRELSHIKSINYLTPISLRNMIKKAGAYDVLYHFDGKVLEVSRSNLFIVRDNVVITPANNILPGITRSTVIHLAREYFKVEERDISTEELFRADEVFMTGTTKRVLPVQSIDYHRFGDGKPGPVTAKLKALYRDFENSAAAISNSGSLL